MRQLPLLRDEGLLIKQLQKLFDCVAGKGIAHSTCDLLLLGTYAPEEQS